MSVTNAAGQDILPGSVLNLETEIVVLAIVSAVVVRNVTNAIDLDTLHVSARRSPRGVIAVMERGISQRIAHKALMNRLVTIVINPVTLRVVALKLVVLRPHKFVTTVTKKDICRGTVRREGRRVTYVVSQAILVVTVTNRIIENSVTTFKEEVFLDTIFMLLYFDIINLF